MSLFLFYSAPVDWGTRTASACSFYPGGSFFLHRLCGGTRRAGGSPERAGRFSLNLSGWGVAAPRGGGKRVDTCGFYPLNSRFPLFLSLEHTRDRRPLRNREVGRGIFSSVGAHSVRPLLNLYAMPDTVLLYIRLNLRRRDMTVSRNPLTRYTAQHL